MDEGYRAKLMTARQRIIRALHDRITVFRANRIRIDELLDGDEGVQYGLPALCSP
jgi:hypothetical protein